MVLAPDMVGLAASSSILPPPPVPPVVVMAPVRILVPLVAPAIISTLPLAPVVCPPVVIEVGLADKLIIPLAPIELGNAIRVTSPPLAPAVVRPVLIVLCFVKVILPPV